jgi:hypothetical protein
MRAVLAGVIEWVRTVRWRSRKESIERCQASENEDVEDDAVLDRWDDDGGFVYGKL